MKNIIKKIFIIMVSGFIFVPYYYVFAQPSGGVSAVQPVSSPTTINFKIDNPFKGGASLTNILNVFLENIIMPLATVLVVLAIIYSGFKFVMAQGDPGEIKKAREGLMYVLIGAAILLGATGISAAVKGTLSQLVSF